MRVRAEDQGAGDGGVVGDDRADERALAPRGQGWRVIREGTTRMDGTLPVNPSGGLKSRGHPIGATGVSQHVMAAMQLTGDAGAMQVPGAELAGVFNMGGTAVANYCSILEREK